MDQILSYVPMEGAAALSFLVIGGGGKKEKPPIQNTKKGDLQLFARGVLPGVLEKKERRKGGN